MIEKLKHCLIIILIFLNGPDAPDLYIRELDKELIFTLSNGGNFK